MPGIVRKDRPAATGRTKSREIVVELARELKLSRQRKIEVLKENRQNRQRNGRIREKLGERSVADTYESRLRMRLYEQLTNQHPVARTLSRNLRKCWSSSNSPSKVSR